MPARGVLIRVAAGSRPCTVRTVRYRPLGSPTDVLKRSYVHVPRVTRPWHQQCTVGAGSGGYQEGCGRWVPGGCYTGY